MHWYHHYPDPVVHWTWYYMIHWPPLLHVLVIHRYVTRISATHICSTGTRIYQFTEYRISYYCYHRYMDARYTVISCSHITVTYAQRTSVHACIVSIFLSYESPFIVHVLLFHVILYDCFLLLIMIFPLLDMRAVDMRCVELSATWIQTTGATSRISHLLFLFFRYLVLCYQQSLYPIIVLHVPCTILVLDILCS